MFVTVKEFDVAGLPVAQVALEYTWQVTTEPLSRGIVDTYTKSGVPLSLLVINNPLVSYQ
jgi:hypothetical protein